MLFFNIFNSTFCTFILVVSTLSTLILVTSTLALFKINNDMICLNSYKNNQTCFLRRLKINPRRFKYIDRFMSRDYNFI